MKAQDVEKMLTTFELTKDGGVKVKFKERITLAPELDGGPNVIKWRKHSVEADDKPQKNLIDCMTKLRKIAMEALEMTADAKELPSWTVCKIKISGDVVLRQSRVKMTLSKKVERTGGKRFMLEGPQITMYGNSEFSSADKMSTIIEDLIAEIWQYCEGHGEMEILPLFAPRELEEAA